MPLSSMVDLEAGLQPSPKPRAESHTLLALEWALRWAMRVLSPCLVVFTTALVFTFVQIFFSDLVYLIATPYTVSYCAHSAAVLWIAANGMFNMLMCALTSPGYAPTRDELHRRILDGASIAPVLESTLLKPPRSQYCAISQKQVLKMDHFCPWVANSLGLRNYRYFYLFIWYLTVASWYGCSLCLFPFLRCRYQGNRYVQQTICVLSSRVKFALASSISVGSLVTAMPVSYTHLRAHETVLDLVCRLLLEKKKLN
eukprot:TRINITY_DN7496_c0_g1_i3.p1 TRINITY_DN7496_c0_g1~~TRINITY_DN7496_c0_g1_i3.p1  ORF type:complete len:256 (-),score=29.74 TRINITY_DN7496_c0_g1_i3:25-792(-)